MRIRKKKGNGKSSRIVARRLNFPHRDTRSRRREGENLDEALSFPRTIITLGRNASWRGVVNRCTTEILTSRVITRPIIFKLFRPFVKASSINATSHPKRGMRRVLGIISRPSLTGGTWRLPRRRERIRNASRTSAILSLPA